MHRIFFLTVLLFLAGCLRVGPNFKPPVVPAQDSWLETSPNIPFKDPEMQIGPWWHNYQSETLNRLVDYAIEQNYSLEAAAWRIVAARANLGVAIGQFFPQKQQAEGYSFRHHISANAPNTLGIDRDYVDSLLGFRVAWELDFWGRFFRGAEAAYGELLATKDDYFDVQRLLISDLVIAYIQYKTFQNRISILQRNVDIQARSAEIAKVRWEEGYESELDYAQAVTLWKETEGQKTSLEIELKRVFTSIAILVGLTPEQLAKFFTMGEETLQLPLEAAIDCPAEILYQRPDLRRSVDLIFAQNARVGIAVSELFPHISFTGFIALQCASDTHSTANQGKKHFFSRKSLTFFYGPEFTWAILNYGRLENQIREEYAILYQAISLFRNQVLEAFKEVEDSLTFFVKSIEQTTELEQSFKYAKRSVDISTLQYQEGLADYTRVLNSLQLQVSAEDQMAVAEGNIGIAYANIYRSLGTYSCK